MIIRLETLKPWVNIYNSVKEIIGFSRLTA